MLCRRSLKPIYFTNFSTSCCCETNVKKKNVSKSSRSWLSRHLNDPFVKQGMKTNFRARSAFKLIEINDKYKFLKPGLVTLECGAAPGAWTQVTVANIKPEGHKNGLVIATDLLNFFPVGGVTILPHLDFKKKETHDKILAELNGRKIDVCLSDMCPNISGTASLDQVRSMELVEMFYEFAIKHSAPGACLLCKLRSGSCTQSFVKKVSKLYDFAKLVKPSSSRNDSNEIYLFASGFRSEQDVTND